MSNLIKVWRPSLDESGYVGLTVPYSGQKPMTRELYEGILEDRLRELIDRNPQRARDLLTSSPEHSPNLYAIGMGEPVQNWPIQIVLCDQTHMRLNQIDFQKGQSLTLKPSELPDLEAILEAL